MGFDKLLGNARVKQNLQQSIHSGKVSHFYLIAGPEGAGKKTLARLLAAALVCQAEEKPCLQCAACRKVMDDTHPDFITVQDPEHKNVAVKIVRQVREEMFVRPNEASKKIYLFAQELGTEGQNALLKILEEPPEYGVFMLLTDNPERLLETVRSRATLLNLQALPEAMLKQQLQSEFPQAQEETIASAIARSGGYLGQAKRLLEEGADIAPQTEDFVKSYAEKDTLLLAKTLIGMEKWKRDQLIQMLEQWKALVQNALSCREGMPAIWPLAKTLSTARSARDLLEAVRHLQKAIDHASQNVSVGAVCGYLQWVLR